MAQSQLQAGMEITAQQAQAYMVKQLELKECLQNNLLNSITSDELKDGTMNDMKTFYSSNVNAFLFDKDLVTSFFQPNNNAPTAKYLMVIIGAKPTGDLEAGKPTIVLAGVNDGPEGTYLSLPIAKPAREQPTFQVQPTFPAPGLETSQIVFTLV